MKINRPLFIVAILSAVFLGGCQGERITGFEKATDDGQWRFDGTLIRSYNVTLTQAYDSALKLAKSKHWIVSETDSGEYKAHITARTVEHVKITFDIWAPPNKATDIGIGYGGATGDKIGSTHVFDDLERVLPGKRITVNKP